MIAVPLKTLSSSGDCGFVIVAVPFDATPSASSAARSGWNPGDLREMKTDEVANSALAPRRRGGVSRGDRGSVVALARRGVPFRDALSPTSDVLLARGEDAYRRGVRVRETLSTAPAVGDPRLVERLIANVLDNALANNQPHGHIDVVVSTRGSDAVLSVTNTGPVVPATEIERLLQPFQRNGTDRTGHGHGVGLGLSIVQAIAEAHGAELDVSPRTGGGLIVRSS